MSCEPERNSNSSNDCLVRTPRSKPLKSGVWILLVPRLEWHFTRKLRFAKISHEFPKREISQFACTGAVPFGQRISTEPSLPSYSGWPGRTKEIVGSARSPG